MGCSTILPVVVALSAVGVYWLNTGGVADGTLPFMHLTESHGYSHADIQPLIGQTAVVTGASSGLGLGVARALALHGATLTVTARSQAKCDDTLSNIREHVKKNEEVEVAALLKQLPSEYSQSVTKETVLAKLRATRGELSCVVVELLDLKQTHAAATDQLISKFPSLDMLVLNAGIMAPPTLLLTDNGKHEQQWQVNHLAQFQLLKQLTPSLKKAPAPRVVFVSSLAHYFSPAGDTMLSLSTMRDPDAYSPNTWYGWSKLCNILTARHLAHLEPSIASHAVHPGGVQGKLLRYAGVAMGLSWDAINRFESWLYWDVDTAALTVLRPLVAPDFAVEHGNGRYLVPVARERTTSAQANDGALAARLWKFSEEQLQHF